MFALMATIPLCLDVKLRGLGALTEECLRDSRRLAQLSRGGVMPTDQRRSPHAAAMGRQAEPVRSLPWQGSTDALLALASRGAPELAAVVYDRFAEDVHRVVYR